MIEPYQDQEEKKDIASPQLTENLSKTQRLVTYLVNQAGAQHNRVKHQKS